MEWYRIITVILSSASFLMSYYSVQVAQEKEKNPDYKAACDLSDQMSCSNAFVSKDGKGFGVMGDLTGEDSILAQQYNGLYGMCLYAALIVCSLMKSAIFRMFRFIFSLIGFAVSTYGFFNMLFVSPYLCVIYLLVHSFNYVTFFVNVLFCRCGGGKEMKKKV